MKIIISAILLMACLLAGCGQQNAKKASQKAMVTAAEKAEITTEAVVKPEPIRVSIGEWSYTAQERESLYVVQVEELEYESGKIEPCSYTIHKISKSWKGELGAKYVIIFAVTGKDHRIIKAPGTQVENGTLLNLSASQRVIRMDVVLDNSYDSQSDEWTPVSIEFRLTKIYPGSRGSHFLVPSSILGDCHYNVYFFQRKLNENQWVIYDCFIR